MEEMGEPNLRFWVLIMKSEVSSSSGRADVQWQRIPLR